MYITCQQCSTIFRLDEKLLKPAGSKVRCSQCKNIFTAHPPTPDEDAALPVEPAVAAAVAPTSEALFDQELEGIDLAELDSILEQDSEPESFNEETSEHAEEELEGLSDFDEADLDIDFEAALLDDANAEPEAAAEAVDPQGDEADLDMDFTLSGDDDASAGAAADETPVSDLDAASDLNADIEMVLDDFEDTLGQPETESDDEMELSDADLDLDFDLGTDPVMDDAGDDDLDLAGSQALLDADAIPEEEADPEEIELSLDDDEALALDDTDVTDETPAAGALDDDLDLGDFDALLEEADSSPAEAEVEDIELSLDDTAAAEDTPAAEGDDLGLGDLESLLDDDDDTEDLEVENQELSLDDAAVPATAAAAEEIEGDDLDLGDFGSMLDEADEDDVDDAEPQDLELSLDDGIDASLDDDGELAGEVPAIPADELDLGDLESMLDDDDVAEDMAPPEAEAPELELSLDDGDDLSLAEGPAATGQPAGAGDDLSDDLDLGSLDSLLDDEDADDEDADDVADADMEDIELSLDDAEAPAPAADAAPGLDDDLSLDGLDDLLDVDEPDAPEEAFSLGDDDDGLDLGDLDDMLEENDVSLDADDDVDLSLDLAPDTTDAGAGADEEIEDLEFELDAEFEDKPLSQTDQPIEPQAAAEPPDEELDLSDIEQMLEDDTLTKSGAGGDAEKWAEDEDDDLGMGGDGEIDLAEIEEAIDAADSEIDATDLLDDDESLELDLDLETPGSEGEELDLELEMESEAQPMQLEEDEADSDELDLSDIDLSGADGKSNTTTETVDGGDIELEFQIDDTGPLLEEEAVTSEAESATAPASARTTEVVADTDFSLEETMATEPFGDSDTAALAKAPGKKRTSKSLVVILLLALLGGGGYLGYDYVVKNDIQIPYLSEYLNPQPKDPTGTMNLTTLEINSKFLENEKSGRLFIVTGKVRNGYSVPCKMVRLKGKLFTKGKVLAKTEHTFAGVVIPDQELATTGLVEIKKQLNAPLGAAAAAQVMAGKSIAFMVVFSELPDDLDEFAIELVSATKIE